VCIKNAKVQKIFELQKQKKNLNQDFLDYRINRIFFILFFNLENLLILKILIQTKE